MFVPLYSNLISTFLLLLVKIMAEANPPGGFEVLHEVNIDLVQNKKAWLLQHWDPSMIVDPMSVPDHHVDGRDPDWKAGENQVYHLVDPFKKKEIGFWETRYHGVAYIYRHGYLRRHPTISQEYTWCHNPNDNPYKIGEEGIYFLLCGLKCLEFIIDKIKYLSKTSESELRI